MDWCSILLWPGLFAGSVFVGLALWLLFGDTLLTLVCQKALGSYIGTKFSISWRLRGNSMMCKIENFDLQPDALKMINPLIPLPGELKTVALKLAAFELVSLWKIVRGSTSGFNGIRVDGFKLDLVMQSTKKWIYILKDNAQRFEKAVDHAKDARIALVNAWTTTIIKKLAHLAKPSKPQKMKKKENKPKAPVPRSPHWKVIIDNLIESFQFVTTNISINIYWDISSSMGLHIGSFHFPRSEAGKTEFVCSRNITLNNFYMYLNPYTHDSVIYLLEPVAMTASLSMPTIMQNLLYESDTPRKSFDISIDFPVVGAQILPPQISALMKLLKPIAAHAEWSDRALQVDKQSCDELSPDDAKKYMELYEATYHYNKQSLISKLYARKFAEQKNRLKTLAEYENSMDAIYILRLRRDALKWKIPSAGTRAPYVSDMDKDNADLEKFITKPVGDYMSEQHGAVNVEVVDQSATGPPLLHDANVCIWVGTACLRILDTTEKSIMKFFASNLSINTSAALDANEPETKSFSTNVVIHTFGIHDTRNDPNNVFSSILDRNPDADNMTEIAISMLNRGHIDINMKMADFSFLVIPDPFFAVLNGYLPALDDLNDADFDADYVVALKNNAVTPLQPKMIYKEDLPKPYTPLLLGGMPLSTILVLDGCELCLLGDPASFNSHVLALTSNVIVNVSSSQGKESINLQLVDVALQPASLKITDDDAIDLEISGLRTILELEGEGVDFELVYSVELKATDTTVGVVFSSMEAIEEKPKTLTRWGTLRTAVETQAILESEDMDRQALTPKATPMKQSAGAVRQLSMDVHDLALNFSKDDIAVLLNISTKATECMKEDAKLVDAHKLKTVKREKEIQQAEDRFLLNKLKNAFSQLDVDGGGSLDSSEVQGLLDNIISDKILTKDEFDATVELFLHLVDQDGSGDISFDEFARAFDADYVHYDTIHRGVVTLTGQEFVNPNNKRSSVPQLTTSHTSSTDAKYLVNLTNLSIFWKKYLDQTGVTSKSLQGQSALVVQKKMVRTFQNYEYAQEAWNRIINPSLLKTSEKSPWLLTRQTPMEGPGNLVKLLHASFTKTKVPSTEFTFSSKPMLVETNLETKFGGMYLRLLDVLLPVDKPSIEIAVEEIRFNGKGLVWEGGSGSDEESPQLQRSSSIGATSADSASLGDLSFEFTVFGNYYNSHVRQIEPFLEPYQGCLTIQKASHASTNVTYSSDKYFHLNVTAGFMDTIQSNIKEFSSAHAKGEKEREHIQELNGIFWMNNLTGTRATYWLETIKVDSVKGRNEHVKSSTHVVADQAFHPCLLEDNEDVMKEKLQQNLKEKEMRAAFKKADADGSGELEDAEVCVLLENVWGHDNLSDDEMNERVAQFMSIADTDGSGAVSWSEFQIAMATFRPSTNRTLSLQIDGFEQIDGIPIDILGKSFVYELVPVLEDLLLEGIVHKKAGKEKKEEEEKRLALLYEWAKTLFMKQSPSRKEMAQSKYLFEKVVQLRPNYEWAESYLQECQKSYFPQLVKVAVGVDGNIGMLITISSALFIKNATEQTTQVLLFDHDETVVDQTLSNNFTSSSSSKNLLLQTMELESESKSEAFRSLSAQEIFPIPLHLVDRGSFAIRQLGELEWSDKLDLSVNEQQNLKRLQLEQPSEIVSSNGFKIESKVWTSQKTIDGQPISILENYSESKLSHWIIELQPQFVFRNSLPCDVEYAMVQETDCPSPVTRNNPKKKGGFNHDTVKDWFQYVNQVNARCGIIESGKFAQVSGLDLSKSAFIKYRLLTPKIDQEDGRGSPGASTWSDVILIHLESKQEMFHGVESTLAATLGPEISFLQSWEEGSARTLTAFVRFWIQNKSGLKLNYKFAKGSMLSPSHHEECFGRGSKVPLFANLSGTKTILFVQPYDECEDANEFLDWKIEQNCKLKKYLPHFNKLSWSDAIDMSSVGTSGDLNPPNMSFFLSYEISVAPHQFNRTKIITIYPRYIVKSYVDRSLQFTPLHLDRHGVFKASSMDISSSMCAIDKNDIYVLYSFHGASKKALGMRLRDITMSEDDGVTTPGEWTPNIHILDEDKLCFWSRGLQGNGPMIQLSTKKMGSTTFISLSDSSNTPPYRIENRSTRHSLRYIQASVAHAEEIVLKPMHWHSFCWVDPTLPSPSIKVFVGNNRKPISVDLVQVGRIESLSPDAGKSQLYGEIYLDGATRVLSFGDSEAYHELRHDHSQDEMLSNLSIDIGLYGFGVTIVDSQPQEVMNITAEGIHLSSPASCREIVFEIHHVQIDDMMVDSMYPVVFQPLDSGFYSVKQEGWTSAMGERPFFKMAIDAIPGEAVTIFNIFEIRLQSMVTKINLDYILLISDVIFRFIPAEDKQSALTSGIEMKNAQLRSCLTAPSIVGNGSLLFFKQWLLSEYEFHLVFDSNPDKAGSGIASILGDTLGSIVGGIAHITPEFKFKAIKYENSFFYSFDLIYAVVLKIAFNVLGQWYKVVGSIELLGDPVGLASDIMDGLALAVRQTKRDLTGKSQKKGKGAVTLLQTFVGAPSGALGKATNGFGDVLKKATYFEDQELSHEPRHLPEGLLHGGIVFGKSLGHGISGLVTKPIQGAKKDGFKGFSKGLGQGAVSLIASPLIGVLGAVEKFSQSIANTTHLMDEPTFEGTRRPARNLTHDPLKRLTDSNVMTQVEVYILKATGLPENSSAKVYVKLLDHVVDGNGDVSGDVNEVDRFKTSTIRHTSSPEWNQSRLFDVASIHMTIQIEVFHKRSPLPKKLLGRLAFGMSDIFQQFEAIPHELLLGDNTNAREILRSRKRHQGSIFNQCTLIDSSHSHITSRHNEDKDKKAISSRSARSQSDDVSDVEDAETIINKDRMIINPLIGPVVPKIYPLEENNRTSEAKLYLSIRYINDMRR